MPQATEMKGSEYYVPLRPVSEFFPPVKMVLLYDGVLWNLWIRNPERAHGGGAITFPSAVKWWWESMPRAMVWLKHDLAGSMFCRP